MNTDKTSNGQRLTKSIIDKKTKIAKAKKLQNQIDEYGHNFCETCFKNSCIPITVAHKIIVNEAQKNGKSELCWDLDNLVIEGMECHRKRDLLDLKFANIYT